MANVAPVRRILSVVVAVVALVTSVLAPGLPAGAETRPANDSVSTASLVLSGDLPITHTSDADGAGFEADEPFPFYIFSGEPKGSVWFEWTAATDAAVAAQTCGSEWDTQLAVYEGASLLNLQRHAANDDAACDGGGTRQSRAAFAAHAGHTYRIQAIAERMQRPARPDARPSRSPGDLFAIPIDLGSALPADAAHEPRCRPRCGRPAQSTRRQTVWFEWTAPATMDVTVDTCDTNYAHLSRCTSVTT